jgi:hypothetical protein
MNYSDWNTPLVNSLKGTDAVVLQQIIRNLVVEIQRLNSEIKIIKDAQNINVNTGVLRLR